MNGNDTANFKAVEINDQVAANLGEWATYTVRYNASSADLAAMNGLMSVKIQPLGRRVGAEQASALIDDLVLSQQSAAVVGPQLTVKVAGISYANGADATLFSPLLANTTPTASWSKTTGPRPCSVPLFHFLERPSPGPEARAPPSNPERAALSPRQRHRPTAPH